MSAQESQTTVTPDKTAVFYLIAPPAENGLFLDVLLKAYQPPSGGVAGFLVTASAPNIGRKEVGRMAIFPAEPFIATAERDQRGYRYDVTAALGKLAAGVPVTVEVSMYALDNQPLADGHLDIAKMALTPRL